MYHLKTLHTIGALKEVFKAYSNVKLYGAGYYLDMFLNEVEKMDRILLSKIECIIVSKREGNCERKKNIMVIPFDEAVIKNDDAILLTLGSRYVKDVYKLLEGAGAAVFQLDFNMFQESAYLDVKSQIQVFIDGFPQNVSGFNQPCLEKRDVTAWSLWWQGLDHAPELVCACLESQRRNLPSSVKQIIITKENYEEYITIPVYILEKVERGMITFTTFSDIIRSALLYRYGGFWMDSTLLVLRPLNNEILDYPFYTRNLPETQFCTNAMWADWFLYAKPGNRLFQFLMEAFFYYYSVYDAAKYYFLVDYIIAIACNTFPELEWQFKQVPYNNEKAMELGKHLMDSYDEQLFNIYTTNTFVQKLTYKLNWDGRKKDKTIYQKILEICA